MAFIKGDKVQSKHDSSLTAEVLGVTYFGGDEILWLRNTTGYADGFPTTYQASSWEPYVKPNPKVGERWGYSPAGINWVVVAVDTDAKRWVMAEDSDVKDFATPQRTEFYISGSGVAHRNVYVRRLPENDMVRVKDKE